MFTALMLSVILSGGLAMPDPRVGSQSRPSPRMVEDSEREPAPILGAWHLVKMSMAGKETRDPELTGSTWTFGTDSLTLESRAGKKIRFQITFDRSATPPAFYAHEEESGRREHGWMIYRFVGETLEIGFFDGLGEKPAGFEAEKKLVLIELKRSPAAK